MQCPRCGSKIEKEWSFCPGCGSGIHRASFTDMFNDIFSRMRRELKDIDKDFEKDMEAFDISPWFQIRIPRNSRILEETKPKKSGFSIRIFQSTGKQPQISVKTFGDVDKESIQKQIYNQVGLKPAQSMQPAKEERRYAEPRVTEEPKTEIKRLDSKVIVDIDLPGVKSAKDISVSELENSVEIRASAGDKVYFKILTKPGQFALARKEFDKDRLHLEFS